MRIRAAAIALAVIAAACGGDGEAGTTTTGGPPTTTVTTTTDTAPTTTTPATTTTTLIDGPVDLLVLTPLPLPISEFGPAGVGPVPGSGLTMSLVATPSPPTAPGRSNAVGTGEQRAVAVFAASAGFPGDCLGFTLWADDFSSRYVDGYVPLNEAGCGEPGGPIVTGDQILMHTERTLVIDLGPIPGGPFTPGFQVQNTTADAGFYSVGQNVVIDPITVPTLSGGLVLPFGGDLFEVSSDGFIHLPLPQAAPGACEPDGNTLCLLEGRFQVRASFTQPGDPQTEPGSSVPLGTTDATSPDEVAFWFFDEGNVELVVKMLNGCNVNGAFWALFTSSVEVDLTVEVTDTLSGEQKTYQPPNPAFPAVTDTTAFTTCP